MSSAAEEADRARDALHAIDPGCARDEWVKVGMAARAAGLTAEDFDAWSSSASNYDARDCRDAWRSFAKAQRIGAGTLFYMAQEHGWRGEANHTRPVVDVTELLHQARQQHEQQRQQWQDNRAHLARLWHMAKPITAGDPAHQYLARRGLHMSAPAVLRMHPRLTYWDDERRSEHPAMLAAVTSASGELRAIHRTYLTPDGHKADVPTAKKLTGTTGPLAASSIKLWPPAMHAGRLALGVAEGIETAIAATILTGIPVWSCISASTLAQFEPPQDVGALYIFADNDASGTGQKAAARLAQRAAAAGQAVRTLTPQTTGTDWADELTSRMAGT